MNTSTCLISGAGNSTEVRLREHKANLQLRKEDFISLKNIRKYIYTMHLHVKAYYPSLRIDNYFTQCAYKDHGTYDIFSLLRKLIRLLIYTLPIVLYFINDRRC